MSGSRQIFGRYLSIRDFDRVLRLGLPQLSEFAVQLQRLSALLECKAHHNARTTRRIPSTIAGAGSQERVAVSVRDAHLDAIAWVGGARIVQQPDEAQCEAFRNGSSFDIERTTIRLFRGLDLQENVCLADFPIGQRLQRGHLT
jgi:hypothetical protein